MRPGAVFAPCCSVVESKRQVLEPNRWNKTGRGQDGVCFTEETDNRCKLLFVGQRVTPLMMVFVHFCSVYLHRAGIRADMTQHQGVLVSVFYNHNEGVFMPLIRSGTFWGEGGGV